MAADLTAYLNNLNVVISRNNGTLLSKQLALPLSSTLNSREKSILQFAEKIRGVNVIRACENTLQDNSTAAIVAYRLSALVSILENDLETAYRHGLTAYNAMLDYFSQKDENTTWIIPALVRISNDLRLLAEKVDETAGDINSKFLRESLSHLTRAFTIVAKDRSPVSQVGSKKLAIFGVTNVLFKIYFKVNTLQLCGKLINVVEGPGAIMDNLPLFPVCDVAMYKYYIGRLKLFEDRYEEARDCLCFALRYCPRGNVKNRQRILASLVPVQMCLGVMPSSVVGTTYGLTELTELATATRRGDIGTFNRVMEEHQSSFIRIGVYLVLEQVKMIAYRNLFKRIYLLSNNSRLNLNSFEVALKWLGEQEVDLDEIECILANQIFQNKIKGYISHQKRFLVVSKTEPFPSTAIIKKARA
jgi:hypothetical protein